MELVITLQLPPSPAPFSQAHEEAAIQALTSPSLVSDVPSVAARRSFLVISVPVEHDDAPERPSKFVRAKYASVEAVSEIHAVGREEASNPAGSNGVEWFMAVQSDAGGRIPLTLQEMSMASKIAKDVPLFFAWALKRKEGGHTAAEQGTK